MNKVVILDTNVLLADPNSVLSFPRATVVIPETVLGELDKLKTARVDPDLRFRGREISRTLFELSEDGSLVDGVELPDGGSLRVAPFDSDLPLPSGVSARNADDRILATAYQIWHGAAEGDEVTLVTNDLNMLLKAQTLGIPVARHGDGVEGGFARRYILRPVQRYKVPIGILAVALAVFVAVIGIALYTQQRTNVAGTLPSEFKALLDAGQLKALDALTTLQTNPKDPEALLLMANYYFDKSEQARAAGDQGTLFQVGPQGIRYFNRYLTISPRDTEARSDLATLLFYSGQTDKAIQEVGRVLSADPNHVNGNFNLGLFYAQGRQDYAAAAKQFEKVIALTENDSAQHSTYQAAVLLLEQAKKAAADAGRPLETTGTAQ